MNEIIREIMYRMEQTIEEVKSREENNMIVKEYDTKCTYSMGFWDGFMSGACVIAAAFVSIIYIIK